METYPEKIEKALCAVKRGDIPRDVQVFLLKIAGDPGEGLYIDEACELLGIEEKDVPAVFGT